MENLCEEKFLDKLEVAFKETTLRQYQLSILELPNLIVMQGCVKSFFHKQLAQEIALRLLKSMKNESILENEIKVY